MRLILVRHGRTTSNVGFLLDTAEPGADLDEIGLEQADALVARLAPHPIEAVYASNLVRTQQTATPLAKDRGLTLQVLPGLREISAGDDEMSSDATRYVGTLVKWHQGDPLARIPGGEDAAEFLARYDAAIDEVVAGGHGVAMVVSHGAALRTWTAVHVPGFDAALGKGHLENTGIIIIDGSPEDGWVLHELDGVRSYWMPDDAEQGDPGPTED